MAELKVTLKRSSIGFPKDQKETLRALGLRKLNATVIKPDTPSAWGMIRKVAHLVEVERV